MQIEIMKQVLCSVMIPQQKVTAKRSHISMIFTQPQDKGLSSMLDLSYISPNPHGELLCKTIIYITSVQHALYTGVIGFCPKSYSLMPDFEKN